MLQRRKRLMRLQYGNNLYRSQPKSYVKLRLRRIVFPRERIMQELKMPKVDGHWLVYRESFETKMRKGAASKAITDYLESIGYEQTQMNPTLLFQRGSGFSGVYHPNPKRQKTEISVDFASSGDMGIIELVMRVNRFGNMPLGKDYEFWRAELDGMATVLRNGYAEPRLSD